MCIIILKPFGAKMPDDALLKRCFLRHSDGFGLSFTDNGQVHIIKGAMTETAMLDMVHAVTQVDKRSMMMHFRTATHGAVGTANCHPFPLSANEDELGMGEILTPCAVAHNGILHQQLGTGITVGRESKLSDSAEFIKKYLPTLQPILKSAIGLEVLTGFVGLSNKMAFLYPETHWRINTWYEDAGLYFSNESYKAYNTVPVYVQPRHDCSKSNYEKDEMGFRGPHFYASMVFPFKVCNYCGGLLHPTTTDRNNSCKEGHYTQDTTAMCCDDCHKVLENAALKSKYKFEKSDPKPPDGKQIVGGHMGAWVNGVWAIDPVFDQAEEDARYMRNLGYCGD